MSLFPDMFDKPKKKIPENPPPETPAKKPAAEPVRGGTVLRKPEEARPVPERKRAPEPDPVEIALDQSWVVKSLPEWKPGEEILGLYRVLDMKEGGMGRVYIAHHKGWNVKLAIKSPNEMMLADRNNFARVLREASSWIELGLHPNIAYCYYVRSIEDVPHIVVEYVDGGSLREWIAEGKDTGYRVSLDQAIQFCHGMEYAHSKGMIHRDIKPENILLAKDGILKITDFGLVHRRAEAALRQIKASHLHSSAKGITHVGDVMGTPGFIAPEQYQDAAGVDERADIFSFGVCLYEMCCGAMPYEITEGDPREAPDPVGLSKDRNFPPPLAEVLKKCVEWDRNRRYGNFKELRDNLTAIYRGLYGKESPYAEPELLDLEADGLNNRAVSYFDLGKREEAASCWKKAVELNPMHPEATYNSSLTQWREAQIADDEVLRRLDNCANSPSADKRKIAELKSFIHAERSDLAGGKEALKEFPGRFEELFAGRSIDEPAQTATLDGHTDVVTSLTLTPDGRQAVSGSADRTLRLWELATGRCIRTLQGHTGWVTSVAITSDGRYVVSGSHDKTIRRWEIASGQCDLTLRGHTHSVLCVALTSDGCMAVSGSQDETLQVWDLSIGWSLKNLPGHIGSVNALVLTPDGSGVVSGGHDNTLRVWELSSDQCVRTLRGHSGPVTSGAISGDGRYAVSGSADKTLRVWELKTGECIQIMEGHTGEVASVALTGNGRYAVSGGQDGTLRVWELASGRCVRTIEGHTRGATCATITPDGRYAISGGEDKTLRVWKIHFDKTFEAELMVALPKGFKERRKEEDALERAVRQARFLFAEEKYKDSFSILLKAWKDAEFSNRESVTSLYSDLLKKGRVSGIVFSFQKHVLEGHTGGVSSIAVSPGGRSLVSGGSDKTLRVWEVATGKCMHILQGHTGGVSSVAITPDGRHALSASSDKTLRLWELTNGKCLHKLEGHTDQVNCLALTSDGRFAVSGSADTTLRVWELAGGRCLCTLEGHTDQVDSVAITPDGRYAVSASGGMYDHTLRVWELATGQCVHVLEEHSGSVLCLSLTPNGQYVVSGSSDNSLRVWELATGRCVHNLEGHEAYVGSVAITSNGRYAVSGGGDKTLRVWDLETGLCKRELEGHNSSIRSISLTPDGRYAVSLGHDKTLRMWKLETGQCLLTLEGPKGYEGPAALIPEERSLVTGSEDKSLQVWELFWDLEFPDPVEWDEGVRPYLAVFLASHHGRWGEGDFKLLIDELASKRGYGWVRPEGVRKELEKMTREYANRLIPPRPS